MIQVFTNALLASPQNTSILVWIACGGVWLLVAMVLLRDCFEVARPWWSKLLWILLLLGLPVVGGILYSFSSILTADWGDIGALRQQRKRP